MSRVWSMMDIGRRSMMNSQTALTTVSHNIANKATEGYSRQRVEMKSAEPTGLGKLRIGNGAFAGAVTRTNNEYLERQIEQEGNGLGYQSARAESLGRVEQVYNEQVNKGLNKYLGDFFNAYRELSNNPESLATRTLVKESADFLAKDFHRVNHQLTSIQTDIDNQIVAHIEEINEYAKEIAQLNTKVAQVEIQGGHANDERDRRDMLLKKLSQKINIRYAEGDTGQVHVMAGNSAILVSGFEFRQLEVGKTSAREGKREGSVDIFFRATDKGSPIKITSEITGGELGGLLDVRDKTINGLLNKMDNMAFSFAEEINRAHAMGFNKHGQNGVLFFAALGNAADASARIGLSSEIEGDVGKIAAGAAPNAAGDNRVANIISSMQYQNLMSDRQHTFDEFYNTIVGQVGIESKRATSGVESQKDVVKQLKNIRESISGVSLDEETTKMIEFQKSFDASARMIRTADEMMDTVLNLKR